MEKVELQFKTVPGGTFDGTFNTMKEYQNAGLAGRNSKIIFNGVEVAAGYYETWEKGYGLYEALVGGDLAEIKGALPEVEENELLSLEASVSRAYQGLHQKTLSNEYLDSFSSTVKKSEAASK